MTKSLVLGTVLGGLMAFLWSSVSWELLGWHEKGMLSFQNEDDVSAMIALHTSKDGIYLLPSAPPSEGMTAEQNEQAQAATMAKMQSGPIMFAAVRRGGFGSFARALIIQLLSLLAAAFLPVGKLADYSNSGTLFAFMMVAISVMVLRRTDPRRRRPFRTPAIGIVAPLAIIGCLALYVMLPPIAIAVLPVWGIVGLLIYFGYSRRRSHVGRGILEVPELAPDAPGSIGIAPMPGAPVPPQDRG